MRCTTLRPPPPTQESWRGLRFTLGMSPQGCHPRSQCPPPGQVKPPFLHLETCKEKSPAASAPSPTCSETQKLTPRPLGAVRLALASLMLEVVTSPSQVTRSLAGQTLPGQPTEAELSASTCNSPKQQLRSPGYLVRVSGHQLREPADM